MTRHTDSDLEIQIEHFYLNFNLQTSSDMWFGAFSPFFLHPQCRAHRPTAEARIASPAPRGVLMSRVLPGAVTELQEQTGDQLCPLGRLSSATAHPSPHSQWQLCPGSCPGRGTEGRAGQGLQGTAESKRPSPAVRTTAHSNIFTKGATLPITCDFGFKDGYYSLSAKTNQFSGNHHC